MKTFKLIIGLILILQVSACSSLFAGNRSDITITFSNQTQIDVCEIYISSDNANDWGENKLTESERLADGAEKSFTVKRGNYDLLARSCGKESMYSYHEVSSDFTAVIGGQGKQSIRVVNWAKAEICFVFISPVGTGDWGEDQLGGVESIMPEARRLFFVAPGLYNLRAEDCNKNVLSEVDNFDPSNGLDWSIQR